MIYSLQTHVKVSEPNRKKYINIMTFSSSPQQQLIRTLTTTIFILLFITSFIHANVYDFLHNATIKTQSTITNYNSLNATIVNIPIAYQVYVNKLAKLQTGSSTFEDVSDFIGSSLDFLTSSTNPRCVISQDYDTFPSINKYKETYNTIVKSMSNASDVCNNPTVINTGSIPIETAHYSYIINQVSPSVVISTLDSYEKWLNILRNSMVSKNTRLSLWNATFSDAFKTQPVHNAPFSFDFVPYSNWSKLYTDSTMRKELISYLQEDIVTDMALFKLFYSTHLKNNGTGLAYSPISSKSVNCGSIFTNSTLRYQYHAAIMRINARLAYFLTKAPTGSSRNVSTVFNLALFNAKTYFDDSVVSIDYSFNFEATRRMLFNGIFDDFLSLFIKNPSSKYLTFTSSDLQDVYAYFVHPACFTYYYTYSQLYLSTTDSTSPIIANDAIYITIASVGFLIFMTNLFAYFLGFKIMTKKRLFLPLSAPPFLFTLCIFFVYGVKSNIPTESYWVQMALAFFPAPLFIASYLVSVSRFTYLKNIEKCTKYCCKSLRFHRCMTSRGISIFAALFLTIFLFIVCGIPILIVLVALVFSFVNFPTEIVILMIAIQTILLLFIATLFFIFDLASSGINTIKKKGLSYYLAFDDPFMYRTDLFLMFIMFLSAIPFITGAIQDSFDFFVLRKIASIIYFLCFYLVLGGSVSLKFWFDTLSKLVRKKTDITHDLQKYMNVESFREMFKSYCENEFSSENYLLYEELEKLQQKGKVYEDDLVRINTLYLANRAQYEVNLPSVTKRKFRELLEDFDITAFEGGSIESDSSIPLSDTSGSSSQALVSSQPKKKKCITVQQLKDVLAFEVVKNMVDTYSRLELTSEFNKWKELNDFKAEQMGVDV
ncbi:predicted protein [Naegleria gruberi]|uniref:Predicted protein n=1 Tax=Naegleria gruberi TaxID=5762 RepID=D2VWA9_NAEGR|nr:uncharacterized protein NAEGRDRAFT_52771 [Naegleria gruberi]EFC38800.1 predicted protein [Naegleria gruberi]|eukprot:XP_002671544.1 predicted protein [Naegleria gruberi strain NEG-M]